MVIVYYDTTVGKYAVARKVEDVTLVERGKIDHDPARGGLSTGDKLEPDPDFPGHWIRVGDYR